MRKFMCVLFIFALCISLLAGCADAPKNETVLKTTASIPAETEPTFEPEPSAQATEEIMSPMEDLQQLLHEEKKLCAVAYLGACEGDFAALQDYFLRNGLKDALPFLDEVTEENFLCTAGTELYLVIQRDDVAITVYEQELNEETYELTWGTSLYVGYEMQPLLLQGNVSDIVPNMCLYLEEIGGESVEYSPYLSLEDGELAEHSMIYDLSQYHLLSYGYDGPVVGSEDERIGSWYAETRNSAGDTMVLEMVLDYDGTASYSYGLAESEFYGFFSGSWYEEGEKMIFDLYGEDDALYAEFHWEYSDGRLILQHVGGTSLLDGLEGASLEFYGSNREGLIALWQTSEYSEQVNGYVYYELGLTQDGTCHLLMYDVQGTTHAAYEGTWSFENGEVSISMVSDTAKQLNAILSAALSSSGSLTLTLLSGDALTNYMSQYGVDYFEPMISYG